MKTTFEKTMTFLKLCSILCITALVLYILHAQGYRINISNSLPDRIFKISDISGKTFSRGDCVAVDISLSPHPSVKDGLERGYLGRYPMIKKIGATPGDEVLIKDNIIYFNGIEYGPMKVQSADSKGNPLSPYPTPITLQPGQYWLISNPNGGFDSRYFGWVSRDWITHLAYPVF